MDCCGAVSHETRWREVRRSAVSYAASLGLGPDDSDDIVHTVILRLLAGSHGTLPPTQAYMNRAVLNAVRDQARAHAREVRSIERLQPPSSLVPRPDELLDLHKAERRFLEALSELPPTTRKYYSAVELDGIPISDVADRYRVSRKAIEMRLASARTRIRSHLTSI